MTALVGPVPSVRFRDGTAVAYKPPKNTLDPRWEACVEHRPACDCREAEMAEQIGELRAELDGLRKLAEQVLAGHPTYAWEDGPYGERAVGCACTGCVIARGALLLTGMDGGPSARDAVDGLSIDEVDCGRRWQMCVTPRPGQPCSKVVTRDRGRYHEHKVERGGALVWLPKHDPSNEPPF